MPYYKTLSNSIHFLDSNIYEYLLPVDSVEISESEAKVIVEEQQKIQYEEFLATLPNKQEIIEQLEIQLDALKGQVSV